MSTHTFLAAQKSWYIVFSILSTEIMFDSVSKTFKMCVTVPPVDKIINES